MKGSLKSKILSNRGQCCYAHGHCSFPWLSFPFFFFSSVCFLSCRQCPDRASPSFLDIPIHVTAARRFFSLYTKREEKLRFCHDANDQANRELTPPLAFTKQLAWHYVHRMVDAHTNPHRHTDVCIYTHAHTPTLNGKSRRVCSLFSPKHLRILKQAIFKFLFSFAITPVPLALFPFSFFLPFPFSFSFFL